MNTKTDTPFFFFPACSLQSDYKNDPQCYSPNVLIQFSLVQQALTIFGNNNWKVLLVKGAHIEQQARGSRGPEAEAQHFPAQLPVAVKRSSVRAGVFT